MDFTTTNLDHIWGSYDFIVDQIGGRLNMSRLKDHEELRSRLGNCCEGLLSSYHPQNTMTTCMACAELRISVFGMCTKHFVHISLILVGSRGICRYCFDSTFRTHFGSNFALKSLNRPQKTKSSSLRSCRNVSKNSLCSCHHQTFTKCSVGCIAIPNST